MFLQKLTSKAFYLQNVWQKILVNLKNVFANLKLKTENCESEKVRKNKKDFFASFQSSWQTKGFTIFDGKKIHWKKNEITWNRKI
jgi:hypothetical protein